MDIGSKVLAEVNLILPQSTSLTFDVIHKDDGGVIVDHSASTARMALQAKDRTTYHLDSCCTCTADYIRVTIPASLTQTIPLGKMSWDMIVTTTYGDQLRLCYGSANIVDTYALDEEH